MKKSEYTSKMNALDAELELLQAESQLIMAKFLKAGSHFIATIDKIVNRVKSVFSRSNKSANWYKGGNVKVKSTMYPFS